MDIDSLTVAERAEFDRLLAETGVDAGVVRHLIREPDRLRRVAEILQGDVMNAPSIAEQLELLRRWNDLFYWGLSEADFAAVDATSQEGFVLPSNVEILHVDHGPLETTLQRWLELSASADKLNFADFYDGIVRIGLDDEAGSYSPGIHRIRLDLSVPMRGNVLLDHLGMSHPNRNRYVQCELLAAGAYGLLLEGETYEMAGMRMFETEDEPFGPFITVSERLGGMSVGRSDLEWEGDKRRRPCVPVVLAE